MTVFSIPLSPFSLDLSTEIASWKKQSTETHPRNYDFILISAPMCGRVKCLISPSIHPYLCSCVSLKNTAVSVTARKSPRHSSLPLGLAIYILRKTRKPDESSVECYGHGFLIATAPRGIEPLTVTGCVGPGLRRIDNCLVSQLVSIPSSVLGLVWYLLCFELDSPPLSIQSISDSHMHHVCGVTSQFKCVFYSTAMLLIWPFYHCVSWQSALCQVCWVFVTPQYTCIIEQEYKSWSHVKHGCQSGKTSTAHWLCHNCPLMVVVGLRVPTPPMGGTVGTSCDLLPGLWDFCCTGNIVPAHTYTGALACPGM